MKLFAGLDPDFNRMAMFGLYDHDIVVRNGLLVSEPTAVLDGLIKSAVACRFPDLEGRPLSEWQMGVSQKTRCMLRSFSTWHSWTDRNEAYGVAMMVRLRNFKSDGMRLAGCIRLARARSRARRNGVLQMPDVCNLEGVLIAKNNCCRCVRHPHDHLSHIMIGEAFPWQSPIDAHFFQPSQSVIRQAPGSKGQSASISVPMGS
ncbi:MAG: hypothetical protein R8G34_04345 [Paracoccaceae bacterium]|nr:hypothetical protein [Paracoccaceae bacterium]